MTGFTLENVRASYDGRSVLSGFSASFNKNEIYVLMGPSGCGKTTLLRLLLGLKKPDAGILYGPGQFRCAAVFQEDRLCETLSAKENIELICKEKDTVATHLQALGLAQIELDKPVRELSGGQRRRVALVRAMLFPSDFIVMDEPFKGLDEETRAAAIDYVLKNRGDRGLILVTHDPEEAALFGGTLLRLEPVNESN